MAAGKAPPRALLLVGALYGLGFGVLGLVGVSGLWPTLALVGLASGCIYTPALCLAGQAVPQTQRSTAMGLLNGAGTFGMMLGTALAGLLSAALMHRGWTRAEATTVVFAVAGGAQWVALALAVRSPAREPGLAHLPAAEQVGAPGLSPATSWNITAR